VKAKLCRQLAQPAGPDRRSRLVTATGDRLHVVEDQHPGHPAQPDAARHQPAEECFLAHVAGEAHKNPAAVFEPAAEKIPAPARLLREREGANLAPIHLQILGRQPLEADWHVRYRALPLVLPPQPSHIGAEVAAAALIRVLGVGARQLQQAYPTQPLADPSHHQVVVGVHCRPPLARRRMLVHGLSQDARDRGRAMPQRLGDLPDALAALGQEMRRAAFHLPYHPLPQSLDWVLLRQLAPVPVLSRLSRHFVPLRN
jgi:hypothetical protein